MAKISKTCFLAASTFQPKGSYGEGLIALDISGTDINVAEAYAFFSVVEQINRNDNRTRGIDINRSRERWRN